MQVIAHRGASAYAPENTVPAFDLALAMGADALETDIRTTRDGVLVLLHDHRVERTTNGHGDIAALTWAEVQSLDAGSWFAPEFAGARVPSLANFLARYAALLPLALEIKADGIECAVIAALAAVREAHEITITSFSFATLAAIKKLQPTRRIGWLTRRFDEEAIARVRAIGGEQICPPADQTTAARVALAKERGLEVRAWGVRDEAAMIGVVEAGADGMTVNFPDKLIAYLRQRGLR